MQILISPAKKMKIYEALEGQGDPCLFKPQGQRVLEHLQSLNEEELKLLYKCSDEIAHENYVRLQHFNKNKGPALLSYEGIQYQYMAAKSMSDSEYGFLNQHLFILSALYGLVRPLDNVSAYRLEMQAKLALDGHKNLYSFWGESINEELAKYGSEVLNLASAEYSKVIDTKRFFMLSVNFMQDIKGKLVERGTMCKMTRGLMVKFIASKSIDDFKSLQKFTGNDFCYSADLSSDDNMVFVQKK